MVGLAISLSDVADIAAIVTAVGVVVAVFAYLLARRQVRLQVLALFYEEWGSARLDETKAAIAGNSPADVTAMIEDAAKRSDWDEWLMLMRMPNLMEGVGSFVKAGGVRLRYVDDWLGGSILQYWYLYEPSIRVAQASVGSKTPGSNFERLAERVRARRRRKTAKAARRERFEDRNL